MGMSTNSLSQETGTFIGLNSGEIRGNGGNGTLPPLPLAPLSKLLQEANIVAEEVAYVVDVVLQHGGALDAHAEGEAGELARVVAAVAQDDGMDHAGAGNLQPAGVLADAAAGAATNHAVHVHLDARLGEREVAAAEAHALIGPVHQVGEFDEDAFQVGDGDLFADGDALDLVEHELAARRDLLVAIDDAGQDDADRLRVVFAHGVNLA